MNIDNKKGSRVAETNRAFELIANSIISTTCSIVLVMNTLLKLIPIQLLLQILMLITNPNTSTSTNTGANTHTVHLTHM